MPIARRNGMTALTWLSMLYVDPEHQDDGVGTQLLQAIADRTPQAKTLPLDVLQKNEPAIAWCQRRGFEVVVCSDATLSGRGEPVYHMGRRF